MMIKPLFFILIFLSIINCSDNENERNSLNQMKCVQVENIDSEKMSKVYVIYEIMNYKNDSRGGHFNSIEFKDIGVTDQNGIVCINKYHSKIVAKQRKLEISPDLLEVRIAFFIEGYEVKSFNFDEIPPIVILQRQKTSNAINGEDNIHRKLFNDNIRF